MRELKSATSLALSCSGEVLLYLRDDFSNICRIYQMLRLEITMYLTLVVNVHAIVLINCGIYCYETAVFFQALELGIFVQVYCDPIVVFYLGKQSNGCCDGLQRH